MAFIKNYNKYNDIYNSLAKNILLKYIAEKQDTKARHRARNIFRKYEKINGKKN